jgi:hypothetical protein
MECRATLALSARIDHNSEHKFGQWPKSRLAGRNWGVVVDRAHFSKPTSSAVSTEQPTGGRWGYSPTSGHAARDQNTNDLPGRERFRAHKAGVLSNASYRAWSAIRKLCAHLRPGSLTREILRECCNLPSRITVLRESKLCLYGLPIGRLQGNHVDRLGNERTRACSQDMQDIALFHPRATLLDRQLFVRGWQKGAEWALGKIGIPDPGSSHKDQAALSTPGNEGGNSMLPQAVQQRDQPIL